MLLELDKTLTTIRRFCTDNYRTPPARALYLMLFHELTGAPGMAINGRVYLGNTPTMVAGTATKMRFGVVGMGNSLHTFHIHGHRWIVPGPDGNNPGAIQSSPQVKAISQFEDTRIFGPANSFGFTIDEKTPGSFMRAGGISPDDAKGEWHMHCHVLGHMMAGMMGSLLIIGGGELASLLPAGTLCPEKGKTIVVNNNSFTPANIQATSGQTVIFDFQELNHTITTSAGSASPIEINGPGGLGNNAASKGVGVTPVGTKKGFMVMGNAGDQIKFECGIHGFALMHGIITITA
jgi:plastocyanin